MRFLGHMLTNEPMTRGNHLEMGRSLLCIHANPDGLYPLNFRGCLLD